MSHTNIPVVPVLATILASSLVNFCSGQVTAPPSTAMAAAPSGQLPRNANQQYQTYDLSRYTSQLKTIDRPQQAIVDWILRETGTDVWFTEPFGFINANGSTLTVYHTPAMQNVVKSMLDRFVSGPVDQQLLRLRLLTVSSPNWRARALPLIQDVNVQSPGVQAWLMTKENAAVLTTMLKNRTDTKTIQDMAIPIYNGQSQSLETRKSRNFVRTIRQANSVWPPYEPDLGEIKEGYQLEISPLLDLDNKTLECVVRANIDQVDKLIPVNLELPMPNGQIHRARIEVPQVVSWRLHERFRWDRDKVLLLSCGVIASPDRGDSTIPLINFNRLMGNTPGRADALLFIEFGGPISQGLADPPMVASPEATISRGRY